MLSERTSRAIIAVSNLPTARRFYTEVLGLTPVEESGEVIVFATGETHLVVYRSDFAGTNKANAVVFDGAGDIEAIVADLTSKGVMFEQYDLDGFAFRGGIHHAGEIKLVWFKDPDGNIIHINEMPAGSATPTTGEQS
jgi:catechol 2,3-dioxygenase-like lactoylglutathione lyase family enzyme